MLDHLIFLLYILIFCFSTIGYGFFFSSITNRNFISLNIGYQGLFGFFFLVIISSATSFLFKHGYFHNAIIHLIGILFLIFYFRKISKNDQKLFFIIFLLMLIGAYVYKNHDDFPYYHLSYALSLSENKFIIGMGNLGHGFRTFSSLFFFHSILYLPYIKFYLFHIGPFLLILYFNFIVIKKIFYNLNIKKASSIVLFFSLFSFTFVNVAFYRLSEHGTDRSPQILIFLIFIILLELFTNKKKINTQQTLFQTFVVLLFLISSLKVLYYIYFLLIPLSIYVLKINLKFLKSFNLKLVIPIILSLFLNTTISFMNTGCFLYPQEKTCLNTSWSIPPEEVKDMNTHYQWWSKAGGGPNYKHDMKKEIYIKDFNWVSNWIERHFFNKVSDTLLGVLFICFLYFIIFRALSLEKNKNTKINFNYIYLIIFIILSEWFLNHPAMRYGGYVLISLPLFLFFSNLLSSYKYKLITLKKIIWSLLILIICIYETRNILRLNKEIDFYKYNLKSSPFFKVVDVENTILFKQKNLIIYKTIDGSMCWGSNTPCGNRPDLKMKIENGYKIIYRGN